MPIALPPPPPGPMPPTPKVLRLGNPGSGFDIDLAARRAAKEMGATVVVEDTFLALPVLPADPHWGLFRWRGGDSALPPGVLASGALPMPVWMDPSVTRSGGNIVSRVYSLGGTGF